jgi:hypothetical protein
MSGTKTIVNQTGSTLQVVLWGRVGDNPASGNLNPVAVTLAPGERRAVQYGNNGNPYLNTVQASLPASNFEVNQSWAAVARGGAGTLDALFNTNSVLAISYNGGNYGFGIAGSN